MYITKYIADRLRRTTTCRKVDKSKSQKVYVLTFRWPCLSWRKCSFIAKVYKCKKEKREVVKSKSWEGRRSRKVEKSKNILLFYFFSWTCPFWKKKVFFHFKKEKRQVEQSKRWEGRRKVEKSKKTKKEWKVEKYTFWLFAFWLFENLSDAFPDEHAQPAALFSSLGFRKGPVIL